jgi:hypothetical protein
MTDDDVTVGNTIASIPRHTGSPQFRNARVSCRARVFRVWHRVCWREPPRPWPRSRRAARRARPLRHPRSAPQSARQRVSHHQRGTGRSRPRRRASAQARLRRRACRLLPPVTKECSAVLLTVSASRVRCPPQADREARWDGNRSP